MRRSIDAACEPARNDQPARRKLSGERPGPLTPAAGGGAGTDDGDLGPLEDSGLAAAVEHWRRTGDGGKLLGIATRSNRHDRYSAAREGVSLPADDLPIDTAKSFNRRARESQCREFTVARLEQPADAPERFERPQDRTSVARPGAADCEPLQDVGFGRCGLTGYGHGKIRHLTYGNNRPQHVNVSIRCACRPAPRPCASRRFPCQPRACSSHARVPASDARAWRDGSGFLTI